jgi:hypothetical protein
MKGLLFLKLISSRVIAADLIAHAFAHPEGDVAYSFDAAAFKNDCSHLPIGVFDFGIGGLKVMEALLTLDVFHNGTLKPGADGKPEFADARFISFPNPPRIDLTQQQRGRHVKMSGPDASPVSLTGKTM